MTNTANTTTNTNVKALTNAELTELITAAQSELAKRAAAASTPKPATFFSMWNVSRYNGGWAKEVKGVDKTKTNGFSIIGGFIECDAPRYWKEGELILDCDIAGSRKHQEKRYTLLQYRSGELIELASAGDSKSWAVKLWDAIEAVLGDSTAALPSDTADDGRAIESAWEQKVQNDLDAHHDELDAAENDYGDFDAAEAMGVFDSPAEKIRQRKYGEV